jgi:ABC-type dipeptide/oligopeptide/nickel transport system ATPase component
MSKIIAIVGESGSGKSTSIQHLDPKSTYIINVAGKELPFKGSSKLYNSDNKNYYEPVTPMDVFQKIQTISEKAPHIKDIIIEDANYLMSFNLINKALETGFTKFSLMAKDMVSLIQGVKRLRDDLNIFYFTHSEEITDGDDIISYKIKTSGKMIDNQIVMEGLFTIVLYTYIDCKGDKCSHHFITNRFGKIPAKSPMGLFDTIKIDNNLKIVTEKIREYYEN